jgi:hypothetical protein
VQQLKPKHVHQHLLLVARKSKGNMETVPKSDLSYSHRFFVFVFGILLSFVLVSFVPATASAETLEADMQQLSTDLESNSELSDFSGFSAEHQLGDERALGSVEWLEEMFTGTEMTSSDLDHGSGGPDFAKVEDFLKSLESTYDTLPADGSVDGALGGEAADLAAAGGIVAAGATSALAVIPIGADLTYEDITSGTNIVSRALFSGTEDHAQLERNGPVGAEGMRWQYFPPCTGHYNEIECVFDSPAAEVYKKDTHSSEYGATQTGNEPRSGQYVLEPEISGTWYDGAYGCLDSSVGPFGGELKPWPEWDVEASKGNPCNESGEGFIAGWPQNLSKVATFVYFGIASASGPESRIYGEGSYYYRENGKKSVSQGVVIGERSPSRMHEALPHKITKSEAETLERKGRVSYNGEAHGLNKEELGSAVKKMAEHEKQGGQRRLEQGVCHVVECELEASPETESSAVEPAVPAKEAETPPAIPGLAQVPACIGVASTGSECKALVEHVGFTEVSIEVLSEAHADLSRGANEVVRLEPGEGSYVETSHHILVLVNPSTLPREIPAPAKADELASEYQSELESDGFTHVSVSSLPEVDIDPHVGPDDVAYTSPAEGTVQPLSDLVDIESNPDTAPSPSESGGIPAPTLPGIHVPNFTVLCTRFPFGVPCWLYEEFSLWSTTAVVPKWEIPIEWKALGWRTTLIVSLEPFEGAMEIIRPVLIALSTIALVILFYSFAIGGSPGVGSSDDEGESG